jgi:hypothetical protein
MNYIQLQITNKKHHFQKLSKTKDPGDAPFFSENSKITPA